MSGATEQDYAERAYDLVYQQGIGEFGATVRLAIVDTAHMLAGDDGVLLDDQLLRDAARRLVGR